jgi:uncharacterized membrane protein YfcA
MERPRPDRYAPLDRHLYPTAGNRSAANPLIGTVSCMRNKLADTMDSWPVLAIAAVVIAVVGVLQLTSQPDGFSVTIGVCLLLVAVLNGGRAVQAFRRRAPR